MADISRRRGEQQRGEVAQLAGLEPLRSIWGLLGGDQMREFERVMRWEQDRAFMPRFDVKDTRDAYVFKADLPGVKEDQVDIATVGNRLTISGRREVEQEQAGETFFALERSYGTFTRSFILPDGADGDKVRAELRDGVLTVIVPKKPEVQPRKVPLGKGGASTPAAGDGNPK
jgi:HSP20 family protein